MYYPVSRSVPITPSCYVFGIFFSLGEASRRLGEKEEILGVAGPRVSFESGLQCDGRLQEPRSLTAALVFKTGTDDEGIQA